MVELATRLALDQKIPGSSPGGPISTAAPAEGWPSGLRRRPAKALTRKSLVGSNPTPSAWKEGVGDSKESRGFEPSERSERARRTLRKQGEPIPPPPPGRKVWETRKSLVGSNRANEVSELGERERVNRATNGSELGEPCEAGRANPTPSACSRTSGTPGGVFLDGWPSGLRRTPGERVGSNPASWVRIPPRPLSSFTRQGSKTPASRGFEPSDRRERARRVPRSGRKPIPPRPFSSIHEAGRRGCPSRVRTERPIGSELGERATQSHPVR